MLFERKGCSHSKEHNWGENKWYFRCYPDCFVKGSQGIAPGWPLGFWPLQQGKLVRLRVLFKVWNKESFITFEREGIIAIPSSILSRDFGKCCRKMINGEPYLAKDVLHVKINNLAVPARLSDHSASPLWPGKKTSIFPLLHGKENYECSVNGNGLPLLLNTKHFHYHLLAIKSQPDFPHGCHLFLVRLLQHVSFNVCRRFFQSNWLKI